MRPLPLLLLSLTTIFPLARPDPTPALFHPNLPTGPAHPQHLGAPSTHRQRPRQHHTPVTRPDGWEDLDLLDVILIQTLDGALHALERRTGARLWSRDAFSTVGGGNATGVVKMRVRPQGSYHDDVEGDGVEPVYILDPHDGQLYVFLPDDEAAQPGDEVDARLQRLPITMEQLIDLSPFTFPQEHSHVFIGSKTTSMRAIDLQTGQDVSSFSPPQGANVTAHTATTTTTPEACEWNAEWGFREAECESDIDDRPEDKLFIGQTSYLLSIHSHAHGLIQQLTHTRLIPNSIHRDLAAYWSAHGQTRGEIYVRPSRRDGYAAFRRERVGGEWENRWRVELTHDGKAYGFQEDLGVVWSADLGSMGVAVFDVLLSAKQHAFPILLPQPPAYPPSLFPSAELALRLAAPSTFVTTSNPTSTTTVNDTDLSHLVALSSCNYPLINLLTSQASEGTLLGRHNISDAVNERLPLLIESGDDSSTQDSSRSAQPTSPNPSVSPHTFDNISSRSISAPGDAPLPTQGRGTFDWWKWVSVFAVFFMTGTIVRVGWLRVRRWRARRGIKVDLGKAVKGEVRGELASAERVVVPVLEKAVTVDGAQTSIPEVKTDPSVDAATPLLAAPVTPASSKAEQSRLPAMSPGQESDELPQRTGKKRRRKRGKGKGKGVRAAGEDGGESEEDDEAGGEAMSPGQGKNGLLLEALVPLEPVDGAVVAERTATKRKDAVQKMDGLTVSDDVLGYGSQGTVVFKGVFQGRAVAVKRLVADHFSIASQEVSLLQASDDHQNVVRYYYQEQREMFLYIALELCPASLADIIDSPQRHQELASAFNPKKAMFQVTAGLKHLHGLKIIHRDLKPQNVLISVNSSGQQRMVLSDFGLAKRLDQGQSSYLQTGNHPVGTTGWLAPECLTGEVDLDQGFDGSSSRHSRYTDDEGPKRFEGQKPKHGRLTRAVDLFALGCVYYYVITSGGHPYGGRYDRDRNIIRDEKDLSALDSYGEDGFEAKELITKLLSPDAKQRPDAAVCMSHPFFWTAGKRLNFLCEASDRFEIMQLDPPEPTLITLERGASRVVGQNWQKALDQVFVDNLGKHRKYVVQSVRDLLRAMRNKKNHYQDLPDAVKKRVGPLPDGYLNYFTTRFPALFTHVHEVVFDSKLRHESQFATYFILDEST
ncbi:bifunctional endoribonuclease/protein kinase ire1 [Naganishia albida]|nr:bifunctional endoribonuclease/protein kinase ire1 [Naganishia albida]